MTAEGFFKELQRLIYSHPKPYTHTLNSENAEYGDQLYYCHNMLYCFDTVKSSDCIYIFDSMGSANCVDGNYLSDCQLCYECVACGTCFNSNYLDHCNNVRDSGFSSNCYDCHDVFGCVSLNSKSFCIFNRQLTEDDYRVKVEQYKKWPPEKILAYVDELRKKYPLTQTKGLNNVNSPYGNYVFDSRNSYMCFGASNLDDCGYMFESGESKSSFDALFSTELQLSYESIDSGQLFNCSYSIWSGNSIDCSYIISCVDLKNCLGCVDLAHKQYCILNRQFTKEEYEKISAQILAELKAKNLGWDGLVY